MIRTKRLVICGILLGIGLAAQAGLEAANRVERPNLRAKLASLPMELGDWSGVDQPISEDLFARAQGTECLSRAYESRKWPGVKLQLWVNFSIRGDNLRHSPEICLPSGGRTKIESQTRVFEIPAPSGRPVPVSRLAYAGGELVEHVGFWYYIFGEGKLENYVRRLSITSESSHGRATRGSSMTIEVFYDGESDPEGEAFRAFARELLAGLEPILPPARDVYHVP